MKPDNLTQEICPVLASEELIIALRELDNAEWPAGLSRFAPFAITGDGQDVAYIGVAWQPSSRTLFTQKIDLGAKAPRSRMPIPVPVDALNWSTRVIPVRAEIWPAYMNMEWSEVPASTLKGFARRLMLIRALLMIDLVGNGNPSDYIINDFVVTDATLRDKRIEEIRTDLGAGPGFRAYMGRLLTRYIRYGGRDQSLLAMTPERGGEGERLTPACKPGRLSQQEKLNRAAARVKGKSKFKRGTRTDHEDVQIFAKVLDKYWAGPEKLSLAATHRRMVDEQYAGRRSEEIPSYGRFLYRYKDIVEALGLAEKRLGKQATLQYVAPRPGSSSDLTQGALEILDVDGFMPKIAVGALVAGKLVPVEIWVIFAVSRLSGGIRGYEISLDGERSKGYVRCLISSLLPMDDRVASLGLDPLPGLLHGNFDGVFVDNGPGRRKTTRDPVTKTLGGIMMNPPGARGDLKAVGERMNRTMIHIMAEETSQGYTRDRSVLEKLKRRYRQSLKPMPLDEFERLLLKAINLVNLTSNKRRLRTAEMRKAGVRISPVSIHEYHQKTRRGEAARLRSPEEVFDIFLPWEPMTSSKGIVKYKSSRYTSGRLAELATAHSRIPGRNHPLKVDVKRVSLFSDTLLCRSEDRTVFELEMVDEDRRRFGHLTWKQQELAVLDETIQEDDLRIKRSQKAGKLQSTKQERVDSIERGRGNVYAGAVGQTKTRAKQNGAALRDSEIAQKQRVAYGLPSSSVPPMQLDKIVAPFDDTSDDDPLAAAARLAEDEYRKSG
jgi:hypothetical protein